MACWEGSESEHEDSGSKEEDTWEDNEGECKEGESEGRREWEHARVCDWSTGSVRLCPPDLIVFGFLSATADGRTTRDGHHPDAVHIGRHALSRRPLVSTQQGTAQE